jgi:hypothetical protein
MFRPMMFVRIIEPAAGRPDRAQCACARRRLRHRRAAAQRRLASHLFHSPTLRYRVTTNCSMSALTDASWFVVVAPMAFVLGPDETLDDAPVTRCAALSRLHARLLAGLDSRPRDTRGVAGSRDPRRDHLEALYVRGHRRRARRVDHVDSRSTRTAVATGTTATAGCGTAIS